MAPFVEAEQVERFIDHLSGFGGCSDGVGVGAGAGAGDMDDWTCLSLYELRERYKQFITTPTMQTYAEGRMIVP